MTGAAAYPRCHVGGAAPRTSSGQAARARGHGLPRPDHRVPRADDSSVRRTAALQATLVRGARRPRCCWIGKPQREELNEFVIYQTPLGQENISGRGRRTLTRYRYEGAAA